MPQVSFSVGSTVECTVSPVGLTTVANPLLTCEYVDVVGGTLLAFTLYWVQWTFRDHFDALFTGDSYGGKDVPFSSIC